MILPKKTVRIQTNHANSHLRACNEWILWINQTYLNNTWWIKAREQIRESERIKRVHRAMQVEERCHRKRCHWPQLGPVSLSLYLSSRRRGQWHFCWCNFRPALHSDELTNLVERKGKRARDGQIKCRVLQPKAKAEVTGVPPFGVNTDKLG